MSNVISIKTLGEGLAHVSDRLSRESELTTAARDQLIAMLRAKETSQLNMLSELTNHIKVATQQSVDVIMQEFTARATVIDELNEGPVEMLEAAE